MGRGTPARRRSAQDSSAGDARAARPEPPPPRPRRRPSSYEEAIRVLAEQIPAVVYLADLRDLPSTTFVTPQVQDLLGVTAEDFVARGWAALVHPDDLETVRAALRGLSPTSGMFDVEYRMRHRGGAVVWVRDRASVVFDSAGAPVELHGLLVDVTARKTAERTARRRQAMLDAAEQLAQLGSWEWYRSTGQAAWSRQACRLHGVDPEAFAPTIEAVTALVHPDDLPWVRPAVEEAMRTGQLETIEYRIVRPDGQVRVLEAQAVFDRAQDGQIFRARGMFRDITDRQRAEEAMVRTQQRFRTLVETMPGMVWMTEAAPPHRPLYVSEAAGRILGFSKDDFLSGKVRFRDRLTPEGRAQADAALAHALAKREPYAVEVAFHHGDGRRVWLREIGGGVWDSDGRLQYLTGVCLDVTDSHETHQRLTRTMRRLEAMEAIVNRSPMIVLLWRIAPGWPVEFVSSNISLLGYTAADLMSGAVSWPGITHPDDLPRLEGEVRAFMQARQDEFAQEYRLLDAAGRIRWVEDRNLVLRDAAGAPTHVQGIVTDITERVLAQEALRSSEEKYRALAESTNDIVYSLDADGTVLYVSPQVRRYGYQAADLVDKPFDAVLDPADRARMRERFAQDVAAGTETDVEFRARTADGQILWLEDRGRLQRDAAGRVTGVTGILRDITDRKAAEGELARQREHLQALASELVLAEERERRRLASDLHDDLAQTLALARIQVSMLGQGGDDAALAGQLADLLDQAVRSVRSVTLQLSHPALYDLGLLAGAQWLAEHMKQFYGLEVVLRDDGRPHEPPERLRVMLFRSLRELLINTAKHAGVASVWVDLERRDGVVRVTVADAGRGFDPAAAAQAPAGIGLFSIRQRLEHLGGRMVVDAAPGRGTRIVMEAPLEPPAPATGGPP